MKTDNFDDTFRQKVESFHPPFQDDEVDRIQRYVSQHIPLSFWQRFGHVFTYSVGTLIIVSLLTTSIYQANENKNLLNKISELNQKLGTKQAESNVLSPTSKTNPIVIEKTDTIYVVKHFRKEIDLSADLNSNAQTSLNAKTNLDLSSNTNLDFNENLSVNKNSRISAYSNPKRSIANVGKKSNLTKTEKYSNNNFDTNKEKNEISPIYNSSTSINFEVQKNGEGKSNSERIFSVTQNDEQTLSESLSKNTLKDKLLTINELRNKTFNLIDLKYAFDLSNRKFKTPRYVAQSKIHSSFKFPSIALPNLKYRIGIGTNIDNGQLGTSLNTDILFAKRWSLTTGVNMSFLGFEHFGDEDDFKRRTDKDFRNQYPVNVPTGNAIENIEAHQVLFKVPIYLNYRWPLRKDYAVLFSTGTDIDFHLKQFTSFSHHNFGSDNTQNNLQAKIPITPFNNWMISTGIEKRWNHFSLQLSPYFSTQIKKVSYRKEDFVFGLKLNGFYRLSR